jgi:hypothetical protein
LSLSISSSSSSSSSSRVPLPTMPHLAAGTVGGGRIVPSSSVVVPNGRPEQSARRGRAEPRRDTPAIPAVPSALPPLQRDDGRSPVGLRPLRRGQRSRERSPAERGTRDDGRCAAPRTRRAARRRHHAPSLPTPRSTTP